MELNMQNVCKFLLVGTILCLTSQHVASKHVVCYSGQSYWCKNITTAAECNAVTHCIHSVWEKEVPIEEDKSSVCQTCMDMVKMARDQLESNETQEHLHKLHPDKQNKDFSFFMNARDKHLKTPSVSGLLATSSTQIDDGLIASYNISKLIAKSGKAHTIGEELILPAVREVLQTVLQHPASSAEELRQVLEGICLVIPEKHLKRDCDNLMDDFGSYLVDTLTSQMNPSVICSVAGLCYSDKFKNVKVIRQLDCDNCNGLMKQIEGNIETASTSDLEDVLRNVCGSLGTFSDVCVSLLAEHMESIDALVRNNIKAQPICDLAGVCTEKYHSHSVKVPTDVQVFGKTSMDDDLPCELCEQLVKHLRDVLIANTTEEEFKMVLSGLCKMSKFKDECDTFIDQYYSAVYYFLVNELDGKLLCTQIKICNNTSQDVIPSELAISEEYEQPPPLPLERMKLTFVVQHNAEKAEKVPVEKSPALCSFCEYFLHYIQQEITLPSTEREIKEVVERSCRKLPATVKGQCEAFIDSYMDQLIAILAYRIDPSEVCPSLGACPGMLLAVEYKDKPTCPLCLLAMDAALKKVTNKSESAIQDVLDDLCMRDEFPTSVLVECAKFITSFKGPITDMIIADFNSQEACVYVDLCSPPADSMIAPPKEDLAVFSHVGNVNTNEISETGTSAAHSPNVCVLCEFVMQKLAKMVADKKTEEEIKDALYKVCHYMPKTVTDQCKQFITQYGNMILELLINEVSPKVVCASLDLCVNVETQIVDPVKRCVICEIFMDSLKVLVTNEELDDQLNKKMMIACNHFSPREVVFCKSMVAQMGPQIEAVIRSVPIGPLACRHLHMCNQDKISQILHLLGSDVGPECFNGPEYWCATSDNAVECDKVDYCQTNVWRSEKAAKTKLKASDIY